MSDKTDTKTDAVTKKDEVKDNEVKTVAKSTDQVVEDVKNQRNEEPEETKDMTDAEQVVVFTLADEEYAVPILDVQEIIPTGEITPFPNVAEYIEGIINVRGAVATIVNLEKRFSLLEDGSEGKAKNIILTNIDKSLFGMMVDEVTEVTKIAKSDIKAADGMVKSKVHIDYISGVAVVGERVILIIDFAKILNDNDIKSLS